MRTLITIAGLVFCLVVASGAMAQTGEALDFDGSDDVVTIPFAPTAAVFTIEMWIKQEGAVVDPYERVYSGTIAAGSAIGFWLRNDRLAWWHTAGGGLVLLGANVVPVGSWHHVAMTYDGTTITAYLDGLVDGTVAYGSGLLPISPTLGDSGTYPFEGQMDEFRIWNFAMTQSEVQQVMNCPTNATGLLLYYKFDHGVANGNNAGVTTLVDYAGGYDGTLSNFSLTGTGSNWIAPGSLCQGTVPVEQSTWGAIKSLYK